MTAADLAPKACDCPFCGGPVYVKESCNEYGVYDGYYVAHHDRDECTYGSGLYEAEAEAVTAHNTLARRAALFPELVELLERVEFAGWDGATDRGFLMAKDDRDVEWDADRRALLKRAAEITPEVQR